MANSESFNLPAFMLSYFNRVDLGGNLFNQWPVGIRFEIGIEQVSRAAKLYEFVFARPMTVSSYLKIGLRMKRL
jgi:hypothetical protein